MDPHARRFQLRQGTVLGPHFGGERWLVANDEVEVDNLVGEAGELVAEAEEIVPSHCGCELYRVILLPPTVVEGFLIGVQYANVDIIIATRDYLLCDTKDKGIIP